jgi:HlyD family secretion protein
MMDVVRIRPRRSHLGRIVATVVAVAVAVVVGALTLPPLVAHRSTNEPAIASDSLVIDTVRRATLERSITSAGTLVPDRVRVVATVADGIVTDVLVRAGAHVAASTVIARLDNPDLAVAAIDATAQLAAARADVRSAREEAAAARLDRDAALRSASAEDARAAVEARSDTDLHAQGLIGDLQYRSAIIKSSEDRDLLAIAHSKISVGEADADAKVAAAQARVDQLSAERDAREAQRATLVVSAGAAGIVQSVAIDPGQRVTSGTELARIADERDLKAVLQVSESDVRGVVPGLPVRVTSSDSSTSTGHVSRIAPAAQNGTVAVDVALDRLPIGARPDQNLDGTIVLDRIAHALSLARPANVTDPSHVALYRLDRDGTHAYRTDVVLGSGSDERVRVFAGLAAGDRVIVSDTSAFTAPTLRIAQ